MDFGVVGPSAQPRGRPSSHRERSGRRRGGGWPGTTSIDPQGESLFDDESEVRATPLAPPDGVWGGTADAARRGRGGTADAARRGQPWFLVFPSTGSAIPGGLRVVAVVFRFFAGARGSIRANERRDRHLSLVVDQIHDAQPAPDKLPLDFVIGVVGQPRRECVGWRRGFTRVAPCSMPSLWCSTVSAEQIH